MFTRDVIIPLDIMMLLVDSTRGTGRYWALTDRVSTRADWTYSDQITSFDSDGFTVGDNSSGANSVI